MLVDGLIILGAIITLAGMLWLIFEMFRTHFLWGLTVFIIPLTPFVWLYFNFKQGWKPFLVVFGGYALAVGSYYGLG